MNKWHFKLKMLFTVFISYILVTGCTKDLSEIVAGEYNGLAEVYFFSSSPSQVFVDTKINVSKLGQTTVRLEITSAATQYNGTAEYGVKYDGTFGVGFYTPLGNIAPLGNEGRFIKDSLYYSYGRSDYIFSFRGRKR